MEDKILNKEVISFKSSKEDIANYFVKYFKISEEAKNDLINQDISGDILLTLDETDLKYLRIKIGPLKKIKKFLNENKELFIGEINIDEKITILSKSEEVKLFLEKYLNFTGDLNNLDGKGLFGLKEEEIKKLGLTLGKTKKLIKYIQYFKTTTYEETFYELFNVVLDLKNEIKILKEQNSKLINEINDIKKIIEK